MSKQVITVEQFKSLFKACKDPIDTTAQFNSLLIANGIDTPERAASFIAQTAVESGNFTRYVENLNYSAPRLLEIFPKYFTPEQAVKYARNSQAIANKVYGRANLGNGNEASGDGWKFRGRGAIQITGKSNYTALAKSLGKTLDETTVYCETLEGIFRSAIWFWNERGNCNSYIDKNDIKGQTKAINGGYHGLEKRIANYTKLLPIVKKNLA